MSLRSVAFIAQQHRIVSALALLLLAGTMATRVPAAAAPTPPAASGSPPAAEPPSTSQLSEVGSQAAALYAQGQLETAIAKLEGMPDEARTKVDRSLLGALYYEAGRAADAWTVLEPLAQPADADPAVLYHAGRTALALGRRKIAATLLERSVRLVPQSPAARELGLLAGRSNDYEKAFALLSPWAMRNPDDHVAALAAAAAAVRIERLREAELLLRAVPESDPGAELLRGQIALRTGKPQEAVDLLERMLDEHPPEIDIDLRRLLAEGYVQTGQSSEAIPLVEPCARYEPRCALLLAEARYRSGDITSAITALESHANVALKDPAALPADARARLSQMHGRLLVAAARYNEALPFLELGSELLPDEPLTWKSLGDALAALGRRDEAMRALERFRSTSEAANERHRQLQAQQEDPLRAAMQQAQQLIEAGRGDEALALVRREIALAPQNLPARLSEIQMLLRLERLDEALATADAVRAAFPSHPDAVYTRGIVHMARREADAAEADFVATLTLAPGHVPALNDYAVLLMTSGRRDEARGLLERALALNPDDPVAARNLESLTADPAP